MLRPQRISGRLMQALPLVLALSTGDLGATTDSPGTPPALALAQVYRADIDVSRYWISEKLDGVRAAWDGHQLLSRHGHVIQAPEWFIQSLPKEALDGELWIGRGEFERLSGAVRRQQAVDEEWRQISYKVYDLPGAAGSFTERLGRLTEIVRRAGLPWLQQVEHLRVKDRAALMAHYKDVIKQGGEGLMLHLGDAGFVAGRTAVLQKLKPFDDGEARVIGFLPGQGKYAGLTGALQLETPDGRRFAVGSGLSDALRRNPPPIGTLITYRHSGLTGRGMPRFPRFYRVYEGL